MQSCLYEGRLRHRRYAPAANVFEYPVFYVYLDLDELDEFFTVSRWWSHRRAAPARFRRADFLGDPAVPLDEAVRLRVQQSAGVRPTGPVRVLTHLRYLGYVMNPVSFYYCFSPGGGGIEWIVAEINNTPWDERYSYVLDASTGLRFSFAKDFHVSPFMPMQQRYDWRFTPPDISLAVHMENFEADARLFDATLTLHRTEATPAALRRVLWQYPLMTVQVIARIYWQALKLWWKGVPLVPHPSSREKPIVHR
ncbi:MAG: DUF1365 domain-containing protein [Bryobacterales bacterium]|nr:DUF1365 domain-containing protein [Bryobacterales bacterium]